MKTEKDNIEEIRNLVYNYFSSECDVPVEELNDNTDIIRELEGDSLMLLALLEKVRKKYGIGIELKTLAKHLMKKPANTIGEVINLTIKVVQFGNDIINQDI